MLCETILHDGNDFDLNGGCKSDVNGYWIIGPLDTLAQELPRVHIAAATPSRVFVDCY